MNESELSFHHQHYISCILLHTHKLPQFVSILHMLLLIESNIGKVLIVILLGHYLVQRKRLQIIVDISTTEFLNEIKSFAALSYDRHIIEDSIQHHTTTAT